MYSPNHVGEIIESTKSFYTSTIKNFLIEVKVPMEVMEIDKHSNILVNNPDWKDTYWITKDKFCFIQKTQVIYYELLHKKFVTTHNIIYK